MGMQAVVPEIITLESVPVFVLIGMLTLFGGISHAPIAIMIMVLEMTGNFTLFVPAMGAVAVSYLLVGKETIFREQRLSQEKQDEFWDKSRSGEEGNLSDKCH